MMKIRFSLAIVSALLGVSILTSCGSSQKATVYTRETEMNEKLQELTQAGWQLHGSARTLRGKLEEHYAKIDANPDLYEVTGTSTGCRSITVCRASAINAACIEMATKMGQELKGKTMRDMGMDEGAELPTEYNRFQEACISRFQGTIKNDLEESMALIRKGTDGLNSYEILFLVNKKSEHLRRTQAIKDALETSQLQQKYAKSVEDFINDESN